MTGGTGLPGRGDVFSEDLLTCYSYNSKSTGRNLLKFGEIIGHDPKNNRLVFGSDWVKGQGQGHITQKVLDGIY